MFSKRRQSNNHPFLKQKRYSSAERKYSNPFFETKKKQRRKTTGDPSILLRARLIGFVVLGFFFFLFWFSFYSNYFSIKSIEARGGEGIDHTILETIAWSQINDSNFVLWQQKNIFIFNKKELVKTLNFKYSFNDVVVNKKLPGKIIIDYNEKKYSFMWLEKGIYYYSDIEGYIIDQIGGVPEDKSYPLIENKSSFSIESNKLSINNDLINYAFLILDRMDSHKDIVIDRFIIENNDSTLKVKVKDGPELFFNINRDVDKQLNKIITLKNEILKDDFFKKEYIDVRIGDRVYHR